MHLQRGGREVHVDLGGDDLRGVHGGAGDLAGEAGPEVGAGEDGGHVARHAAAAHPGVAGKVRALLKIKRIFIKKMF